MVDTVRKKKTSYSVSICLSDELKEMSRLLGVGKSDLVSMSMAFMFVQLAPLKRTPMKRRMLVKRAAQEFQKLVDATQEKL